VHALLLSFAVIFVAELGDKSQLMALTFAARYPPVPILIGITIATGVVHAVSVLIGAVVAVSLPTDAINIAAGVAFLLFAAWTLRGDSLDDDETAKAARAERGNRSAILAASGAFFLAELGDKTMLATITLATTEGLFGTWLGSTLGMVAADALAILAGTLLGRRLPERAIAIGAAVMFVLFGVALVLEGLGASLI
jgi:Ca2+/H+ antiporter, TMEM165/GDT1 family